MSNIRFLCLSFLWILSLFSFGQNLPRRVCDPFARPQLWIRGTPAPTVLCDSVWLVTPYRLGLYEEAGNLVMSLNTSRIEDLISQYEHKLNVVESWNDSLKVAYKLISQRYDSTLRHTSSQISFITGKLNEASTSLEASKEKMDEAILSVRKSRAEKWIWGIGGILAGFGLASLL